MLDDPSAGLAPVLVDRILQIVRSLTDEGLGALGDVYNHRLLVCLDIDQHHTTHGIWSRR